MRITLRVIPSHSLPALPTLAILYATNTLEKNRENQMRKQPLFEKLSPLSQTFITQNEISASPQLISAHNPSSFALFPTSSPTSSLFCWKIKRHSIDDQTTFHRHSSETHSPQPANSHRIIPIHTRSLSSTSHSTHETPSPFHLTNTFDHKKKKEPNPFVRLLPVMLFSSLLLQGFNLAITEKTCTEIDRIPIDFPPFTFARNVSFC